MPGPELNCRAGTLALRAQSLQKILIHCFNDLALKTSKILEPDGYRVSGDLNSRKGPTMATEAQTAVTPNPPPGRAPKKESPAPPAMPSLSAYIPPQISCSRKTTAPTVSSARTSRRDRPRRLASPSLHPPFLSPTWSSPPAISGSIPWRIPPSPLLRRPSTGPGLQSHRNLHRAAAELRHLQTECQIRVECVTEGFRYQRHRWARQYQRPGTDPRSRPPAPTPEGQARRN